MIIRWIIIKIIIITIMTIIIITIIKTKNVKKIVKSACFHVIPYIHSPVKGVFPPHVSVATITLFSGTSLISSN